MRGSRTQAQRAAAKFMDRGAPFEKSLGAFVHSALPNFGNL